MDWLRLRDRKLVQWVVAYCAGSWALLEVVDFVTARFGWPDYLIKALAIILAVGIVVVIVLAWFHGEKGAQRVSRLEFVLLASLLLLAGAGAWAVRGSSPQASPAELNADDGSIAVVPFTNLSANPEHKNFSDGFTDELSNALASVAELHVVAPSAFVFEGTKDNVRQIALDLSARYLLEGSVRRSGEQVRVTARLVNTRDGRQVWSGNYDQKLSPLHVLAVQEEIARAIVSALKLKLAPQQQPRGMTGLTRNQEAHDAYVRGLGALAKVSREANLVAAREFGHAIELDSSFARAWSGLALSYGGWWPPLPKDRELAYKNAKRFARRALELDSTLAEPHVVLARITSDRLEKKKQLETAIRKDPLARWPRYFMASLYLEDGDRLRCMAELDTLLSLDPTSPWSHIMAANLRNLGGEYARSDTAAIRAEQLIALGFGPQPTWALYWNRGYTAMMRRNYERAGVFFAKGHSGPERTMAATAAVVFKALAELSRAQLTEARREAAIEVIEKHESTLQPEIGAVLYLQLNDKERAYRLLESEPSQFAPYLAAYDALRNEPRFMELVQKRADARKRI